MADRKLSKPEVIEQLGRFALFSALDADHLGHIAEHCREIVTARNQMICRRGDPAKGFFAVTRGQVKLVLPSPDGHEKVLEIIDAGHTFGEAVMFLGKDYPVNAEAIVGSHLLHIRADSVFDALSTRPEFSRQMLAGMSVRLHQLVQDVEAYCLMDARQRITAYLLGLVDTRKDGASNKIQLPVNKALLANRLNLTPETFSRILHDLAGAGLIRVQGRNIEIADLDRFSAGAGS